MKKVPFNILNHTCYIDPRDGREVVFTHNGKEERREIKNGNVCTSNRFVRVGAGREV